MDTMEGKHSMEEKHSMAETLQMVKEHLPAPGTMLGEFTFLAPDALWTGEVENRPFVAIAEDRWPVSGGMYLMVTADGPVYIADLESNDLIDYCAASFPQFMEIMKLFLAALETTPSPSVFDDEGMKKCEETEQILRQQIMEIDPTAIEDIEGFWSTWIEELGSGML